jgi:hypothetical protein
MKKFATWCLNHLGLLLGIVVFVVTFAVIGGVMLNSHNAYIEYEKKFNEADLELRSNSPAQAQFIEFQDDYKSEYKNKLEVFADELKVTTSQEEYMVDDYIDLTSRGGTVSIKLSLDERSFVDIDLLLSSEYKTEVAGEEGEDPTEEYGVKDLLNNVTFVVNGENMEEDDVNLLNSGDGPEFHHLIMGGFALPEGEVILEIKSNSGKNALMPQIQKISFFSSAVLSVAEEVNE